MFIKLNVSAIFLFTVAVFSSRFAEASVVLPPGGAPVFLPGASVAAEADLAGTIIRDDVIPFRITNAAGALLFEAKLQNRIVRSARTGLLHFYYRIRDTRPGLNGIVKSVFTKSFDSSSVILADWRFDGLGVVNPIQGQRSPSLGEVLKFNFNTTLNVLVGGRDSRFFFVKTKDQSFHKRGKTTIQLTTGDSATLTTVAPTL